MTETLTRRTCRPLGDRVLVRPAQAADQKGALFIPDQAREQPMEGTVVGVGIAAPLIKPGDVVLYGKYAGAEVKLNEETLLVLKLDDVLGVISEDASE